MKDTTLARMLGQALSTSVSVAVNPDLFRLIQWHPHKGDKPAYLEIEVRGGPSFIVTVNEVK